MTTEEILWAAIKDIESGNVALISEDPMNGFLEGKNKKLTKMNISQQSAKYTDNNKPISRPTIDFYKSIVDYVKTKNGIGKNETKALLKEIERLTLKNKELEDTIVQIKEYADGVAFENLKLNEKVKQLS